MDDSDYSIGEWRTRAACIGLDSSIFFLKRGESVNPARVICYSCTVKDECLEDAIRMREPSGVRGGLSGRERRAIVRKRREAKLRLDDEIVTRERATI